MNTRTPLSIGVVVPSYNQGSWIESCLRSIASEKQPGDRLVVVDNVSQDNTRAVLNRISKHIDHIIVERDKGQADALRKGFELLDTDICAYLNTDDLFLPGAFGFVRKFFATHPQVDAIYGHRIFVNERNQIQRFWIIPFHSDYCHSRWDYIPQETCFWRRSIMEEVGGIDASLEFAMDYDLFVRMMKKGRFCRVNRFLAAFRDHPGSKTRRLQHSTGNREIALIQKREGIHLQWQDRIIGNVYGQLVIRLGQGYRLLAYPFTHGILQRRIHCATKQSP